MPHVTASAAGVRRYSSVTSTVRRALALCLFLLLPLVPGCFGSAGCSDSDACTRLLFLGNSYTSVNDLPGTFAKLARSGGHPVQIGMEAEGGWLLVDHANDSGTKRRLADTKWDVVVLQEQSEIPATEASRQSQMYPAARRLVTMIRGAGARPLFFLAWAHRNGWTSGGMGGYANMQAAIDRGYLGIAAEQNAGVAPVGLAWAQVVAQGSSPGLWQSDGSHPTKKGTYLAACVFYAAVFRQSPVGLPYHDGLSDEEATRLQGIAGATVFGDLSTFAVR